MSRGTGGPGIAGSSVARTGLVSETVLVVAWVGLRVGFGIESIEHGEVGYRKGESGQQVIGVAKSRSSSRQVVSSSILSLKGTVVWNMGGKVIVTTNCGGWPVSGRRFSVDNASCEQAGTCCA